MENSNTGSKKIHVHDVGVFEAHIKAQDPEQNANLRVEAAAAQRILWMGGFFLLFIWSLFLFWIILSYEEVLNNGEDTLSRINNASAEYINSQFQFMEIFLRVSSLWVKHNHDDEKTENDLKNMSLPGDLVREFRRENNKIVNIYAVNVADELYEIGGNGEAYKVSIADREYLLHDMPTSSGGFFVGPPLKGRLSGKWIIPIVWKMHEPIEDLKTVLGTIQIQDLVETYDKLRFKPDGVISVFRSDGILLAQSPLSVEKLGLSYMQTDFFTKKVNNLGYGMATFPELNESGEPLLFHFSKIKNFPIVVTVSATKASFFHEWRRNVQILAIIMLLASISIIFFNKRLSKMLRRQASLNAEVAHLATIDYLTGIFNRRRFIELLETEFKRAQRYYGQLTLFILDLDYFKHVNDTYGHDVGDHVLLFFTETVSSCLRSTDYFGRLGGEEFVVLLPNTNAEQSVALAERICKKVTSVKIESGNHIISISVSIGVAAIESGDTIANDLLKRADAALYKAKKQGRNQAFFLERCNWCCVATDVELEQ